ncbi:MAG: acyl-CoA thioesterase [Bacteroidia bacterium]
MNAFKQKTPIQIRFKDVDQMGHVNNANYITYFEYARMDYFRALMGNNQKIDWQNEGVIIAKVEMEYKHPIVLDDEIHCYTWVSKLGTKSFDMNCCIVKIENGKEIECASGMAILVCFNYTKQSSIPIPEKWKLKIQAV